MLLFIIVTQYCFALFHPQPKNRSYQPYKLLMHNSCKLNYYHPICSIIVVNRTFMSTLQPKTNRCNSDSSFIKKSRRPKRTILFGKSTVQTFEKLDTSTRYANKSETILSIKSFHLSEQKFKYKLRSDINNKKAERKALL